MGAARIVTQARSVLSAQALSAANRRFPVPPPFFSSTRWASGLVAAALQVRVGREAVGGRRRRSSGGVGLESVRAGEVPQGGPVS